MVSTDWLGTCQIRGDAFRQVFAVFDAPLVERVDPPYHSLYKHLVFVQRQKGTECIG